MNLPIVFVKILPWLRFYFESSSLVGSSESIKTIIWKLRLNLTSKGSTIYFCIITNPKLLKARPSEFSCLFYFWLTSSIHLKFPTYFYKSLMTFCNELRQNRWHGRLLFSMKNLLPLLSISLQVRSLLNLKVVVFFLPKKQLFYLIYRTVLIFKNVRLATIWNCVVSRKQWRLL